MKKPGESTGSVYGRNAHELGGLLIDPNVNSREHTIYWPRLEAM